MATDTWLQLSLTAGRYSPEQLEQALLASGALAVTLVQADSIDNPVLEPLPGQTPLWPRTRVTGLFDLHSDPGLTRQRLLAQLDTDSFDDCDLGLSELADRDWVRAWLDDYKPMRFGRRLWVRPSHLAMR